MSDQAHNALTKGWAETTLGDVCLPSQYGWTTSASNAGSLLLLRTTDISHGSVDWRSVPFCSQEPDDPVRYLLRDGDILISRAGSVGKSFLVVKPERAVFASYLIRFRPLVDPRFLHYFLKSADYWQQISDQTAGIATPNVNASKLVQVKMPIAPAPEQSRIADTLDELFSDLDAGVAALERARAKLKLYRASVLKAAVEGALTAEWRKAHPDAEPATVLLERILAERRRLWEEDQLARFKAKGQTPPANWKAKYKPPAAPDTTSLPQLPEGWCWTRLEQLLIGIEAGKSFACFPRPAARDEWGVIKVSAMSWGAFDERENKAIPSSRPIDKRHEIRSGDILLSRANTYELVGASVLVRQCRSRLLLSDKSMRLVYGSHIESTWLRTILMSPPSRSQLSRRSTGTKEGMRNVSQESVLDTAIPLAPAAECTALVDLVEDQLSVIDHMEAELEAKLKEAGTLRQAILRHAFSGRLVPQDPADEPASALLARIAAERAARGAAKPAPRGRKPKTGAAPRG